MSVTATSLARIPVQIRWRAGAFLASGVALLIPLAVARALCCHLSLFERRLIFSWLPLAALLLIGVAFGVWWGSLWSQR
jgi:hypothetical protein